MLLTPSSSNPCRGAQPAGSSTWPLHHGGIVLALSSAEHQQYSCSRGISTRRHARHAASASGRWGVAPERWPAAGMAVPAGQLACVASTPAQTWAAQEGVLPKQMMYFEGVQLS